MLRKFAAFQLALIHFVQHFLRIALENLRIINDGAALGIFVAPIVHLGLQAVFAQNDLIAVAVLAVFIKGLHIAQLLKPALRGTVVHTAQMPSLFLVLQHGVVAGFLGEHHIPVFPAALQLAILGNQMVQRTVFRLEKAVPEIIYSLAAVFLVNVLKKLTVGGDKLSTGNHRKTSFLILCLLYQKGGYWQERLKSRASKRMLCFL